MSKIEQKRIELLESEIAKNNAERLKLEEEREQLSKKKPESRYLIQIIIATVISIGLLSQWFIQVFSPIMEKEVKVTALDNDILKRENQRQTRQLSLRQDSLERLSKRIVIQNTVLNERERKLNEYDKLFESLMASNQKLQADLKNINLQNLPKATREVKELQKTSDEIQALHNTSKKIQSDVDSLNTKFKRIDEAAVKKEKILKELTDRSASVNIFQIDEDGKYLNDYFSRNGLEQKGKISNRKTKKGDRFQLVIDYALYNLIPEDGRHKEWIGDDLQITSYKEGVVFRITFSMIIQKRGLVIPTSMERITTSASDGDISGTMSFTAFGISGKPVTSIAPLPSSITSESVENALLAIERFQQLINNPNVKIDPGIFALIGPEGEIPISFQI